MGDTPFELMFQCEPKLPPENRLLILPHVYSEQDWNAVALQKARDVWEIAHMIWVGWYDFREWNIVSINITKYVVSSNQISVVSILWNFDTIPYFDTGIPV